MLESFAKSKFGLQLVMTLIAVIFLSFAHQLSAQSSPLTVQPSTGNVGVGTTTPVTKLDVRNGGIFLGDRGDTCCSDFRLSSNSQETHLYSYGDGRFGIHKYGVGSASGEVFTILSNGRLGLGTASPDQVLTVNGNASKVGGGSWLSYSDMRLKTAMGNYQAGLKEIIKLTPIRYRYNSDNALHLPTNENYIGLSAQQVRDAIPDAVTENSKGYLMVNNDPVIFAMLNAIKEQQAIIEDLRKRISQLETAR
jgi:trimeric autotransporter adhesin